jgi:hypothetical protein
MDTVSAGMHTRMPKIKTPFDLALSLEFAQMTCAHARETLGFLSDASAAEEIGPYQAPVCLVQLALERVEEHLAALISQAMADAAQAHTKAQEGGAA